MNINNYDIILILSGGLDSDFNPNEWVIRRLNKAIELYHLKNVPILSIGGGTPYKDYIDGNKIYTKVIPKKWVFFVNISTPIFFILAIIILIFSDYTAVGYFILVIAVIFGFLRQGYPTIKQIRNKDKRK